MFQSFFSIFALQVACNSFLGVDGRQQARLVRRTPDPPLNINTLTDKYTFPKNIRWESGTINNATAPYLTTAPSQMPGEIDIRGADDDDDEILTTINTNAASCDPASYSGTDKMEFVFQKDHWNIINNGKGGPIHYGYKRTASAPKNSLVGEVRLTESPYSIVALVSGHTDTDLFHQFDTWYMFYLPMIDKNDGKYTIDAEPNLGLPSWDLISLMIVASKHNEKCS
ncbi:uncharacterized protein MELLADRAFT_86334 [Melampsora larici-populina 98AG31]|uniref:Secreted protein n=1 Tax=Melampsora larici-populina (strain 98AG31 / pathotype 3-4-7) TaxID=747676 RepID=F4SDL9_MELLP|nr:uncharacterized protein MELLADRAFT_86334 [Melampsora larici-populina 98AG31]EGF97257.1 secreted protein [Melampsora larici-populina 98AG31]